MLTTCDSPVGNPPRLELRPRNRSSQDWSAIRFLFYSHDGHGLGHTRRNLALASALVEQAPGSSILLATSVDAVDELGVPPNTDVLKLPSMRKVSNGAYAARRLPLSGGDLGRLRGALLESAVKSFRPSVMLVDKHPLGMRGELRAALERLQAQGGRAVLGLRDILDDPVTVAREWLSERIPQSVARYYDQVLVYGDQRVVDAREEYGMPSAMRAQTRFCGYVADRGGARAGAPPTMRATDEARTRPLVLATAGGGEDGLAVLSTFIRATADAPWDGVVVSGPLSGDAAEMQRLSLESGVGFRRSVPTLGDWFAEVDALVCMGGYNTLSEALCHATPTVCVPRTSPRREQLIRARLLESRGLLRMVAPDELSTVRLGEEIAAVLETTRDQLVERRRRSLEVDGASRAASFLLAQAAAGAGGRTAVPLAA